LHGLLNGMGTVQITVPVSLRHSKYYLTGADSSLRRWRFKIKAMNTLPKEISEKVFQQAEDLYNILDENARDYDNYEYGLPMFDKCKEPIENILTDYATQIHILQQENADLKRKLAESMELLKPLLEYGQSKEAGFPLGSSVTEGILARAKDYERIWMALGQIASAVHPANEREAWSWIDTARSIANAALTSQPEAKQAECTCGDQFLAAHGECYKCPGKPKTEAQPDNQQNEQR